MHTYKLLQEWAYQGETYAKGKLLDIDEDVGDLLVKTGIAECVDKPADDKDKKSAGEPEKKNGTVLTAAITAAQVEEVVDKVVARHTKTVVSQLPVPTVINTHDRILDDPAKGFKNPRAFILDVMGAARYPERTLSDGLKVLRVEGREGTPSVAGKTAGSDEAGMYADPYGGFLVPEKFTPEVLRIEPEADPTAGKTRIVPMEVPSIWFNARVDKNHTSSVSGGLTVSRRAETQTTTAQRIEFDKVHLHATGLYGIAYATEELLLYSAVSFAALLASGFSDEFTSYMINEKLNGVGAGQFVGVNNAGCQIEVAKETGQAADTILYENVIKMRARSWGYRNSGWLANQDCIPQLMLMNQVVGVGGAPVWQPSAREDHPDILLGRPLIFTEYCATVGDAGDILLCNWGEYLEGILQPLQSAESVHVRFVNHERTFKFWLMNAGAPWWRTALTPKNSTNTLSPFVKLAART